MAQDPARRRGNPEPQDFLPDIPLDLPAPLQNLLAEMRQRLQRLAVDPAPPAQVAGVTATATYPGILIRWNKTPKAASYVIYRNTSGNLSTASQVIELTGSGNTSFFDITQTLGDTAVYYWVQALNGSGVPGPISVQAAALNSSAPEVPGATVIFELDSALLSISSPDDDLPSMFSLVSDVAIGSDYSASVDMWSAIHEDEDFFVTDRWSGLGFTI